MRHIFASVGPGTRRRVRALRARRRAAHRLGAVALRAVRYRRRAARLVADRGRPVLLDARRDLLHDRPVRDPCCTGSLARRHRLPGRLPARLHRPDAVAARAHRARVADDMGGRRHRGARRRGPCCGGGVRSGAAHSWRPPDLDCHEPRLPARRHAAPAAGRDRLRSPALAPGSQRGDARRRHPVLLGRGQPVPGVDRPDQHLRRIGCPGRRRLDGVPARRAGRLGAQPAGGGARRISATSRSRSGSRSPVWRC